MTTLYPVPKAVDAVNQLAKSPRGQRVLSALYYLHEEAMNLDSTNSVAMLDLVEVMASHQINGTMLDLLSTFRIPNR